MKFLYPYLTFAIIRKLSFFFFLVISISAFSQVGIGTLNPDASSALDISSDALGVLVPRMTSLDRTAISDPANSLLVYDTDERSFFYYDSIPPNPKWIQISSDFEKRNNHILVKTLADLPAPSGGKITLLTDHLYEINGTITLTHPIDLNNATVAGMDASEDILFNSSGPLFKGSTGGNIKNVTLKGVRAFEIIGPGITSESSLIVQNVIIDEMTSSVGSISGLGLYFGNIIQYLGNKDGITYSNIGNLLLSNQGWFADNEGTFEKYTGSFGLIEKVSGFSTVNGSAVAMDFSSNPSVDAGVLLGHVFSGTTSQSYIKKYLSAAGTNYNFTNAWTVDSPGIPKESDAQATGDINFPGDVTGVGGFTTSFGGKYGNPVKEKVYVNNTTSKNIYRFTRDGNNRITYRGDKKRLFQVNAAVSYKLVGSGSGNTNVIEVALYFAKGKGSGPVTHLEKTKVYGRTGDNRIIEVSKITGIVELQKDEYIELWAERIIGTGTMFTVSLNLSAK